MKQLIIILMMIIICVSASFAQTADIEKLANDNSVAQSSEKYDYKAPDYRSYEPANLSPRRRLAHLLGLKGNLNETDLTRYSKSLPKSKIQLIVDENANIIDCTLIESTNVSKDKIVLNFLNNNQFFSSPSTLNGEPCKSIVMLSIGYYPNGNYDLNDVSYPLMAQPENDTLTKDEPKQN